MNIYDYAKKNDADYMDMNTGYIYRVQDYNRAIKFGLPTDGIYVTDSDGNLIGIAKEA
jgi:hypothetical protein